MLISKQELDALTVPDNISKPVIVRVDGKWEVWHLVCSNERTQTAYCNLYEIVNIEAFQSKNFEVVLDLNGNTIYPKELKINDSKAWVFDKLQKFFKQDTKHRTFLEIVKLYYLTILRG